MIRRPILPVLAAALLAAACGEDGGPTTVAPTAGVRFFNGTTGLTGGGGFTANGRFVTGSALSFGQSTPTCAAVDAGSTSFGFGAANAGGTGLSGNPLATLNNQSVTAGGNYSVVATGSASTPTLFLFDNSYSGSLTGNQAAVRFVNLAPGTANPFNVLTGTVGSGPTAPIATNVTLGASTAFSAVTSGSNAFTILHGHEIAIRGSAASLNLQAGTVNTIAIVPSGPDGFRLIVIPRC